MIKVGVTGGIGSGKTTVCNIFASLGIPIYNADKRAKYLMTHDKKLKTAIKKLLGNVAYHQNGRLNRSQVALLVFENKTLLSQLNALVHPAVALDGKKWFEDQMSAKYAIKEAALMIESGSHKLLDKLIVVTAPESLVIQRVMKRDGMDESMIRSRMKNQLPPKEKEKLADYIIYNDGKHSLIHQVWKIHNQICALIH